MFEFFPVRDHAAEWIFFGAAGLGAFVMWGKPSPHFSWSELTVTSRVLAGGNAPATWEHRVNLVLLSNLVLERIRSACGGYPMKVTSAYRSPELQHALYSDGTSSTDASDHETGCAADLYIPAFGTHAQIAAVIYANRSKIPIRQCIVEKHTGHLHVAMDKVYAFDPARARHQYLYTNTGRSGDYHPWSPSTYV